MGRLRRGLRRAIVGLRAIRVRLTLWYVALLAVVLLAFSTLLFVTLSRNLRAELDRSLAAVAQQVVASLDLSFGLSGFGDAVNVPPVGMVVALYDQSGRRIVANDTRQPLPVLASALARAAQGQETFSTVRLLDGDAWRILSVPLSESGRLIGVLQVGRSEHDVQAALGQLVAIMALAVPLMLVVASAGGLFLARRALGPIDQITRSAEQIGAEDLSKRLAAPATDDEVGRLAATFNRMLDRLDGAFQRQRQFTADASHELRTPLALLTGQIDLALARDRSGPEYREALTSMREDAARLSQLLSELLTLSRADAGQEALTLEPLPLGDLVDDTVAALAPLAEARNVRLERGGVEPVVVRGDQTRLTQLLVNLIDNSLKFTPPGGEVCISVARADGWAVVRVTDNGVGIAAEHLPHLFERFYRVDQGRSRADGGAGLGLAISQWIARAHGGEITVASQPGHGTTFTTRLPLAERSGPMRTP